IPNVVYLQHADGSHTVYSHLAANSITVREGDHIGQGHELARTGLSGWIGPVPHLHFAALTFPSPMVRRTFPVRFSDDSRMLESDGLEQKMDSGEDTDPEGFSYG
ncbi:M23 family metallopeptidase, partial [Candidatus Woesearchaeota archaeon]|nr:M23 family metallopeptidase [Candidatus Woesearchaeota archaeon]